MATLSAEFVFDYFSKLNPIAYKIQAEINTAIDNYEHLWNDLDRREQMTIINETVIKPEIQINYRIKGVQPQPPNGYRDIDASLLNYFVPKSELDRPFSYKTKSQQNLFYSFTPGVDDTDKETGGVGIRLPVAKPKNHQTNKSTDSLLASSVNFVNLNVKAKKGRAPAVPKMTKPPPPPPPTKKVPSVIQGAVVVEPEQVVVEVTSKPLPKEEEESHKDVLDTNSNTSLLSPADNAEEEEREEPKPEVTTGNGQGKNGEEFKLLLSSDGFDFLNNW